MLLNKKAQYTLEYAILIAFIAAALAALQTYMKNCKQGDLRDAGEQIGDPYSSTGTVKSTSKTEYTEKIKSDKIYRTIDSESNVHTTGS